MSEPLSPTQPSNTNYLELNDFAKFLQQFLSRAVKTLELYWDGEHGGFVHLIGHKKVWDGFSKASTATAISFLAASGQLGLPNSPWPAQTLEAIEQDILDADWNSAGLLSDNPFTSSFLMEALAALLKIRGKSLLSGRPTKVAEQLRRLEQELARGEGIRIATYPSTAFLTQKVVSVLSVWGALTPRARINTAEWAFARMFEESVNVAAKGPDADVFELAYAVLTACKCKKMQDMSPRQREAIEFSVGQFFDAQTERGTWPRSRPLFLYPDYGNAYCYDFELLAQLCSEEQLGHLLHMRMRNLRDAVDSLDDSKIRIDDGDGEHLYGWSTGHLKQDLTSPESWSTASVFHACYGLNKIVQEGIRRVVFANTANVYSPPRPRKIDGFSGFLDSEFRDENQNVKSLQEAITSYLIKPIQENLAFAEHGMAFPKSPVRVPTGAILYGPPGTSKTTLAQIIADEIGWPLLKLDPSHLTRKGMESLHAETNDLFSMLLSSQQIVILLDEFDELVRERETDGIESSSRFLTTAMLPKLAALGDAHRIIYVLTTNHIEHFDTAIRRPGRFDLILPVLPPTYAEKVKKWPTIGKMMRKVGTPREDITFERVKARSRLSHTRSVNHFP